MPLNVTKLTECGYRKFNNWTSSTLSLTPRTSDTTYVLLLLLLSSSSSSSSPSPLCRGCFCLLWRCGPMRAMAYSFLRFLNHTQRRIIVGRTPLDEWSARRRDLYLTTHNTHNRQTSMPPGEIRTHDLSKRVAADLRLRPSGYWDRIYVGYLYLYSWDKIRP